MKLITILLLSTPTILLGQNSWKDFESNKAKQVTITKWETQKDGNRKQSGDQTRVVKGYDQKGNIIYVTTYVTYRNTKHDSTTYKYDSEHRPIEFALYEFNEQVPNGYIVEKQEKRYDENNREAFSSTESNSRKSECEYSYKYDNAKRLIEKTISCNGTRFDNEVVKYNYDKKGNLVLQTSSLSTPIKYILKYSKSGKLESRLNLSTSKQEFYDDNGNAVQITEPGRNTYYKYDSDKRIIELIEDNYQSSITGPSHYKLQYDDKGHLIEKADISKKNNIDPIEKWVYSDSGLLTEYIKGTEIEKYEYVFY